VPRSTAMKMVGHRTESIYRRYAIVDEAMLKEGAAKLQILHDIQLRRIGHSLGTNESASYWMPSSTRSSRDGEIIRPHALPTLTLRSNSLSFARRSTQDRARTHLRAHYRRTCRGIGYLEEPKHLKLYPRRKSTTKFRVSLASEVAPACLIISSSSRVRSSNTFSTPG
jgi:hypothetical protein